MPHLATVGAGPTKAFAAALAPSRGLPIAAFALSVFSDELLSFTELFKRGVNVDGFVNLLIFDVILAGLFVLALVGEDLGLRRQPSGKPRA